MNSIEKMQAHVSIFVQSASCRGGGLVLSVWVGVTREEPYQLFGSNHRYSIVIPDVILINKTNETHFHRLCTVKCRACPTWPLSPSSVQTCFWFLGVLGWLAEQLSVTGLRPIKTPREGERLFAASVVDHKLQYHHEPLFVVCSTILSTKCESSSEYNRENCSLW